MRTSTEIFKDLRSAMAELEHALKAEGKGTDEELSPLLKQALEKPEQSQEVWRKEVFVPRKRAKDDTGGDTAPQDRHRGLPRQDQPKHLKDYVPSDDPDWDEAVFMGTGDRRVE